MTDDYDFRELENLVMRAEHVDRSTLLELIEVVKRQRDEMKRLRDMVQIERRCQRELKAKIDAACEALR